MNREDYKRAKEVLKLKGNLPYPIRKRNQRIVNKWEFANQKVIEELERLKEYGFTLVKNPSTVKGNYVIAAYRFDERLEQLKQGI